MQSILDQITEWLKEMLISGIMGNLSGMFDSVNQQVGEIAGDVGMTPASFSPAVFSLIRNISESVIVPIAGLILTFIACYELIQMIIEHNNLANFETWIFFKWVFKTFMAVMLITNCFNITMAVFDVAQHVISQSGGIIQGSTAIDADALASMQSTLEAMDLGPLLGLYLQTFIVQVTMMALSAVIFVIVYGRMIEIYMVTSLAPIPFATFGNREQSHTGQNYLRSLFALGFTAETRYPMHLSKRATGSSITTAWAVFDKSTFFDKEESDMSARLDKIAAEREKARRKRDEWDARMKEWDQKYREQENAEIHEMVHAARLTPEQLAEVLKSLQHGTPDMSQYTNEEENNDEI